MRRAILATLMTFGFLVIEIVGDAVFASKNRWWAAIEGILNFPGYFILYLVGPGHGFSQLVLPYLFVLGCYLALFWFLIPPFQRLFKKFRS